MRKYISGVSTNGSMTQMTKDFTMRHDENYKE